MRGWAFVKNGNYLIHGKSNNEFNKKYYENDLNKY